MKQTWRVWVALVAMLWIASALPVGAANAPRQTVGGTQTITGSYHTTNPIYPLLNAETGVLLYDLTGLVTRDFDFLLPLDAQVLGTLDGDIVSGDYVIELPEEPVGIAHDFDANTATPPAVQVFAAATYIDFLGDIYVNRGETPLDLSVRLEPMTFDLIGGYVIVWAAREGEQFPSAMGLDDAAFTADDTRMTLPAGWSVVSLETEPFTVVQDETVNIPIVESMGALNDYTEMSYEEAWDTLFLRTEETYPFAAEKNLDWEQIYADMTPLVQSAGSDMAFHLAIAQLGEYIPDTHIGFVSMPVLQQYLMGGVGINQISITDDDEVVLVEVAANLAADAAGIRSGDILVAVDGTPALDVLDQTPLLINSASTLHGRRFLQAAMMLQGPIGSSVNLTWRSPDGPEQEVMLMRKLDVAALLKALGGDMLTSDVVSSRMLDSGVGYIQITGFASEVSQAADLFAGALESLMDSGAKGIVIDVRGNTGGLVQLAMAMSGHFFPDYQRLFDFYYADGAGGFAYRGFIEILASQPYYDGPVAVLVNEMTGSAGDLFAYAMRTDGRAMIVGHTPTGGFTGEVGDGQYELPGDLTLQIPTGRPVDPDTGEVLIEGTGVLPTIRVARTWESLI
ncbi:MAG: hypothetical protein EHM39_07715, partial [Chloroflexi bacterium]